MRRRPTVSDGSTSDDDGSADRRKSFWENRIVTCTTIKRTMEIVLLAFVVMALTYTLNGSLTGRIKSLNSISPSYEQLEMRKDKSLQEEVSPAATPGGKSNVDDDDDDVAPAHSHPRIILIGVGTGRCGTLSLSAMLSLLRNSHVTHEYQHSEICKEWLWMPSSEQERREAAGKVIGRYNDSESEMLGDVAFYHLPYVENLLDMDERVMIVFLEREKDGYVKSALKWFNHTRSYPFSHKIQRMIRGEDTIHTYVSSVDSFMACYPKYRLSGDDNDGSLNISNTRIKGLDLSQGYTRYWENYHGAFAGIKEKFPSRVRHLEMKELNNDKAMGELVEWLGFSTHEMSGSVPHGVHKHKARS